MYKKEEYEWLINQNIDIFNLNHSFYNSPCFPFKSNIGKDLTLKDRLLFYFANITLCEEGCEYIETNYNFLKTKCKCLYNESRYNLININLLEDELVILMQNTSIAIFAELRDFLENIKILFLICIKNVFSFKNLITNLGGYIILLLLIIQIICIIIIFKNDTIKKINKFIIIVTDLYIEYKSKKNNLINNSHHYKKRKLKNIILLEDEKIKKENKVKKKIIVK